MSAPSPNYVHRARLARADEIPARTDPVHDGDTFYLRVDLGTYAGHLRIDPVVQIRLKGIDCWELRQPGGDAARAFTLAQLTSKPITVQTEKPAGGSADTLGRTVGQVWVGADDLADLLRADGHEKTPA